MAKEQTVEEFMTWHLAARGLLDPKAQKAVIAAAKESFDGDARIWRDQKSDYDGVPMMIEFTWDTVRDEAVKWIDANSPQHFARSAFTKPGLAPPEPASKPAPPGF